MGTFIQTSSSVLAGTGTHAVTFRPGAVGIIGVTAAIDHPGPQPAGEPLYELAVSLLRPGTTVPLAMKRTAAAQTSLGFTYTITAADLVPAGDWTVRVDNDSSIASSVTVGISYPTDWAIRTATFDIQLFNLLLVEAFKVAQPIIYLESSDASFVSWSAAAAAITGMPSVYFPFGIVGDTFKYKVTHLHTQDISAILSFTAPPTLVVHVSFTPDGVQLVGQGGAPDIQIRSLAGSIELRFDGTATASFTASARTDDLSIDVSSILSSDVESALGGRIDKTVVRPVLDSFISKLLRLDPGAIVTGYDVMNGTALSVSYAVPPPPPPKFVVPIHPPTVGRG